MASVSKRKWTHNGAEKEAWAVRYFDAKGKHRQKTFKLKKDADRFATKMKSDADNGLLISVDAGQTVEQLCNAYLRHTEDRVADGRVQRAHYVNMRKVVVHSILPYLGKRKTQDLQPIDIEGWYRDLCRLPSVGQRLGGKKKPLSPVTARERVYAFSGMCEWAIRRQALRANPCLVAVKEIGRIEVKPIKTFMPEQAAAVLRTAETRAAGQHRRAWLIMRCAVNIAAFCGLRYGEIMGLTLPRVKTAEGWIEVRHSLNSDDVLKGPKTKAGVRDVPMPRHVAALLQEWIDEEYRQNPRGLLFRGSERSGGIEAISGPSFRTSYWWPLLRRAGVFEQEDPHHFHALRHFAASWMIDNGLPVTDVANLLGHSKFDLTLQIYAHPVVNGRRRSQAFERMADRLLDSGVSHGLRNDDEAIEIVDTKDMISIRAEERLALVVKRPAAFITGNLP